MRLLTGNTLPSLPSRVSTIEATSITETSNESLPGIAAVIRPRLRGLSRFGHEFGRKLNSTLLGRPTCRDFGVGADSGRWMGGALRIRCTERFPTPTVAAISASV
jgi:hypothetical protein